ncbi:condensation domain-containing protein [Salinarimonas rosea]|uniref:condensation domain-containing protein n=1 Tax=Salinarimonas rosea TaxID=552063 RepID=UPI00040345A2|nr:condensation domain-containing protein [Salinarimonas rosea]
MTTRTGEDPADTPARTRAVSPVQAGLLYEHALGGDARYVDQAIHTINGPLDHGAFREAMRRLIDACDALRMRFPAGPGGVRRLAFGPVPEAFPILDARGRARAARIADRLARRETRRPFDLARSGTRAVLVRIADERHVLIWTYHHAIADSWAIRLLQRRLCRIYASLVEGRSDEDEARVPYECYLDWIDRQDEERSLAFWRDYLGAPTEPAVPLDVDLRAPQRVIRARLGAEALARVHALRKALRTTANAVVLSAWGLYILHRAQRTRCVLGCVVSGRAIRLREVHEIVGTLSNTVPVLIDARLSVRDLVGGIGRHLLGADPHAHLSLGAIMAAGGRRYEDLASVVNFTIDETRLSDPHLARHALDVPSIRYDDRANFGAYLDIAVGDDAVVLDIAYTPPAWRFSQGEIEAACGRLLDAMAHAPDAPAVRAVDALLWRADEALRADLAFDR